MSEARPELYIVAGPSGAGKSSVFNSTENERLQHIDRFNIDDRLAQLNNGSYQNIPNELRPQVNAELASFIRSHVEQGKSLSTETTLRHPSMLNWAERAVERGFDTRVIYVAAKSAEIHVQRVEERAMRGGHSAPAEVIRDIYHQSTANVPRMFELAELGKITTLQLYDNSGQKPERMLTIERGHVEQLSPQMAPWIEHTLAGTKYAIPELHEAQGRHLSQLDLEKQQERRLAPLHEALSSQDAQQFRWLAETGAIQSYQHIETQRNIHIDGSTGQFYNQDRTLTSRQAALDHAMPLSHEHGFNL